ncbi:MAG: hypothetical protein ACUVX8_07480 [Candidatus Zipacnadales bacterium]
MSDDVNLKQLWEDVNTTLREGPINRPLWEAARTAVPLALEENTDTLVLGMPTYRMELAGHIETRVNKARLQEIVQAKLGRRLDIKIIEGDTIEAYQRAVERERARAKSSEAAHARAQGVATAAASWDALNEQILLSHSQTENRRYVHNRAKFMIRCVRMMVEAEERIRAREPGKEEFHERQLARTIDKIANLCGCDPTIVSLEYLRHRSLRQHRRM